MTSVVFELGGDRELGPDGFPMPFFQTFLEEIKEDVIAFTKELHAKSCLSKQSGESFVTLISKKDGVMSTKISSSSSASL